MWLFLTKQLPGLAIGGVGVAAVLIVFNTVWDNPSVRAETRDLVQSEARARAMKLIEDRSEDNEEISSFDQSQLCAELGGRWVPNEDRCD